MPKVRLNGEEFLKAVIARKRKDSKSSTGVHTQPRTNDFVTKYLYDVVRQVNNGSLSIVGLTRKKGKHVTELEVVNAVAVLVDEKSVTNLDECSEQVRFVIKSISQHDDISDVAKNIDNLFRRAGLPLEVSKPAYQTKLTKQDNKLMYEYISQSKNARDLNTFEKTFPCDVQYSYNVIILPNSQSRKMRDIVIQSDDKFLKLYHQRLIELVKRNGDDIDIDHIVLLSIKRAKRESPFNEQMEQLNTEIMKLTLRRNLQDDYVVNDRTLHGDKKIEHVYKLLKKDMAKVEFDERKLDEYKETLKTVNLEQVRVQDLEDESMKFSQQKSELKSFYKKHLSGDSVATKALDAKLGLNETQSIFGRLQSYLLGPKSLSDAETTSRKALLERSHTLAVSNSSQAWAELPLDKETLEANDGYGL